MWKYATRRVLTMIPILIGVSMVVFLLVASLPGDAVDAHAGGNITAQNKALLGLDKPIPERYVNWASHAIRGDFGISISYKIPVTEVIGKFVWNSFLVAAVAFILQLLIAIPIGVISATKQYSIFDNTFSVVAFAGISLPSFFLAMILRYGNCWGKQHWGGLCCGCIASHDSSGCDTDSDSVGWYYALCAYIHA